MKDLEVYGVFVSGYLKKLFFTQEIAKKFANRVSIRVVRKLIISDHPEIGERWSAVDNYYKYMDKRRKRR